MINIVLPFLTIHALGVDTNHHVYLRMILGCAAGGQVYHDDERKEADGEDEPNVNHLEVAGVW